MNRLLVAFGLLSAPSAWAQECYPTRVSFGWTMPNNVAITDDSADRWPTDATIRVAYGGSWCPEAAQVELREKEGGPIAAQVRFTTPNTIVENTAQALTVIDIDPEQPLTPSADYVLIVRPDNPSLPAFAEYYLEFRAGRREMDPLDLNAFDGIRAVGLDGDTCSADPPFAPVNANIPACLVSSKFRLKVEFQPLDRSELAYIVYRTSHVELDEAGEPKPETLDNTRVPIGIQPGARDIAGTGLPIRPVIFDVLYAPLPRRECYAVMILDEYGRERGDIEATACVDLAVPEPCPRGCEGDECMVVFPEPNPFETNPPLPGQMCDNLGLNGGNPDRPIPPVGEEPDPTDGGAGGGGETDGGMGTADGGASQGGGGGGGCSVAPSGTDAWNLLIFLPIFLLRRRR